MNSDQARQRAEKVSSKEETARVGRKAMTEYEALALATREYSRLKALRLVRKRRRRTPTAIANSCQQRYPVRVINFIQTRILVTPHSCCRAGYRTAPRKPVSVSLAQCDGGILGYES